MVNEMQIPFDFCTQKLKSNDLHNIDFDEIPVGIKNEVIARYTEIQGDIRSCNRQLCLARDMESAVFIVEE